MGRSMLAAGLALSPSCVTYSASQGALGTERLTGHGVDTPYYEAGKFLPATRVPAFDHSAYSMAVLCAFLAMS
jgi:hypothetical protein